MKKCLIMLMVLGFTVSASALTPFPGGGHSEWRFNSDTGWLTDTGPWANQTLATVHGAPAPVSGVTGGSTDFAVAVDGGPSSGVPNDCIGPDYNGDGTTVLDYTVHGTILECDYRLPNDQDSGLQYMLIGTPDYNIFFWGPGDGTADSVRGELYTDAGGVNAPIWDSTLNDRLWHHAKLWVDPDTMTVGIEAEGQVATATASGTYLGRLNPWRTGYENPATNWGIDAEIDNIVHGPLPEPATMSLLALGGLALLRRRK